MQFKPRVGSSWRHMLRCHLEPGWVGHAYSAHKRAMWLRHLQGNSVLSPVSPKTQKSCLFLPQFLLFFPNKFREYCSAALPPAATNSASPRGVSIVRSWGELECFEGAFKIIYLECFPTPARRGGTDGWARMPASSFLTPGIRWIQAVGKWAAGEGLMAERTQRVLPLVWSLVHHEKQLFWVTRDLCLGVTRMSEILAALRTLRSRGDYLYWLPSESLCWMPWLGWE